VPPDERGGLEGVDVQGIQVQAQLFHLPSLMMNGFRFQPYFIRNMAKRAAGARRATPLALAPTPLNAVDWPLHVRYVPWMDLRDRLRTTLKKR
jgi:hypothetical protein